MSERAFWTHILHRQGILPFVGVTSTLKTNVSGVYTIRMHSTSCRCIFRSLVFGLECWVEPKVDPLFFSETHNYKEYCDNIVYSFIAHLKQDEIDKAYFQQYGATALTAYMSVALLDDVLADRIISKTVWPPRSTDLSPSFFFWDGGGRGVQWKTHCISTISTQMIFWRWPSQKTFGMWTVLYWSRSPITQFDVSIMSGDWRENTWILHVTFCLWIICYND
jgi:hypothetical protein